MLGAAAPKFGIAGAFTCFAASSPARSVQQPAATPHPTRKADAISGPLRPLSAAGRGCPTARARVRFMFLAGHDGHAARSAEAQRPHGLAQLVLDSTLFLNVSDVGAHELALPELSDRYTAHLPPPQLPVGFEQRVHEASGRFFFVDHTCRSTTWADPREHAARAGEMPIADASAHEDDDASAAGTCREVVLPRPRDPSELGVRFATVPLPGAGTLRAADGAEASVQPSGGVFAVVAELDPLALDALDGALVVGDVLLAVDGEAVRSASEAVALLANGRESFVRLTMCTPGELERKAAPDEPFAVAAAAASRAQLGGSRSALSDALALELEALSLIHI